MNEPSGPQWTVRFRTLREASQLTREELGSRSGVSGDSIKAYELGRRNPTRSSLVALLNGLGVDRHDRAAILEQAGFATDSVYSGRERADPQHTLQEAIAEIESLPWPAFIANEQMSVVEANALAQALWGIDLEREFSTPVERNLLAVMTTPRIANQIANWDEAAGILAALVKGSFGEASVSPDGSMPYYAAVMEHLMSGDVTYVQRFLSQWASAIPRLMKWRFFYPIKWEHPIVGNICFHAAVNLVNHDHYLTINEWLPTDSDSWQALDRLRSTESKTGSH